MEEKNSNNDLKQIKKLLKENLDLTKEVKRLVKDVKKHLFWSKVWTIFKIVLIVVPIILGFLYLPAFFQKYTTSLKSSLGIDKVENIMDSIPAEYQQYLK